MLKYLGIGVAVVFIAAILIVSRFTAPQRSLNLESTAFQDGAWSLRFYGNGTNDIDRVKISLDPPSAVDVSEDFTIEFFMRAEPGENRSGSCVTGDAGWINGNIIVDRDVYGPGDYGDYGVSLYGNGGILGFGVSYLNNGDTACGSTNVADGEWHHIALTRSSESGLIAIYVDGKLDGSANGPVGDISYRDGRPTDWPNDPYLVIGAEKHDAGSAYPSFSGWFDELHMSNTVRYVEDFTPTFEAFTPDEYTLGLYHFDEGEGDMIRDSSGTESHGTRHFGGSPQGPEWSEETPVLASVQQDAIPGATGSNDN